MRRHIGPWIIVIFSVLCAVRGALASEGSVSFSYGRDEASGTKKSYDSESGYVAAPLDLWNVPTAKVLKSSTTPTPSGLPSQSQKDATAELCKDRFDGEMESRCYYDLLAMAWKETRFDCAAVGDQGRSYGCYQIQAQLHGVSVEDARDYAKAASWTLDRMESMGYPIHRTLAVTRHNGAGEAARNYAEVVKAKSDEFESIGL